MAKDAYSRLRNWLVKFDPEQVQEVLKILLGKGELLRHRMLLMDAEAGIVDELKLLPSAK